jgi:hypothetical protein
MEYRRIAGRIGLMEDDRCQAAADTVEELRSRSA